MARVSSLIDVYFTLKRTYRSEKAEERLSREFNPEFFFFASGLKGWMLGMRIGRIGASRVTRIRGIESQISRRRGTFLVPVVKF